jgi:hypothetical protein
MCQLRFTQIFILNKWKHCGISSQNMYGQAEYAVLDIVKMNVFNFSIYSSRQFSRVQISAVS